MADTPKWKVFNAAGEYIASCKYAQDAAALASVCGEGARVSWDRQVWVWTEGHEEISAGESDDAASWAYWHKASIIMHRRRNDFARAKGWL